ncbi:MAG: hypothetical protein ACD_46C00662G0001 [uncultured bacterium]|nr:MAG: hypothetical protein ACD_46C00662G0001 [uncultured bacterium]
MKNKLILLKKKPMKLVEGLSHLLADTYVLYLKTQNFHWNVDGPDFYSLHKMFEEQYNQLAAATDEIAERIRALHHKAPGSFAEFLKLSVLHEGDHDLKAEKMVLELANDHESISKSLVKLFEVAKECDDEATLDLFIQRKKEHDKTAWMLRSTLGRQ